MIILKYNFLAAYTKEISKIFENSLGDDYCYGSIKDYSKKILFIQSLFEGQYNEDNTVFIDSIEDVVDLFPNALENFIYNLNYKCTVVFPLIPAEDRLLSLAHRNHAQYRSKKYNNIEEIIHDFFKGHCATFNNKCLVQNSFEHMTFEKSILMKDFETLIDMHKIGKIHLVVITKDTILKHKEKLLKYLHLDIDKSLISANIDKKLSFRTKKLVNADRATILADTIKNYGNIIYDRYNDINDLIIKNNIKVL